MEDTQRAWPVIQQAIDDAGEVSLKALRDALCDGEYLGMVGFSQEDVEDAYEKLGKITAPSPAGPLPLLIHTMVPDKEGGQAFVAPYPWGDDTGTQIQILFWPEDVAGPDRAALLFNSLTYKINSQAWWTGASSPEEALIRYLFGKALPIN